MKWNDAQLSAIMTRDKNILVSAAAGSGKTAVLTERIKRLVTKEGVGIDEMLIVTFTNAAAGEMRERIYNGITEALDEEGADIEFLQEQLDKIGTADISTFHAFCLKVIREYFYMTELEPGFKICDEAQSQIFAQESMSELMKEYFEMENNEEFLSFVRKYSKAGNEKGISDMITAVHKFIKSLPDPLRWLEDSVEALKDSEDEIERKTYASACVLRDMTLRYDEIFMGKKLAVNQIDFNDIEHMALKILENPEPCGEYREKFRHIFIDEYQDTNSVQEELISRIKRENNLFMVGDVKQSIYQFRLADPQIFIDKYRSFRAGEDEWGIKIDLNRNFRSKPPVLEATNLVMSEIMTDEDSGISYDEAAMLYPGIDYASTEAADYSNEPVEMNLIVESDVKAGFEAGADGFGELKNAEIEAMLICNRIKSVLGMKYYDSKANCLKTVGYSDIVVIMRSYKGASEVYQEVFRREGIPVYIEGNDGYFETVEIGIFVNLLKLLINLRQDIPLLSVLYSEIFKFSAEELSRIRINTPKGLFSEAFLQYCSGGADEELKSKCMAALERINSWKDEAHYISLKDLLWKIAQESGFYDFICGLPLGSHRAKNLKALINKAEKYQKNTSQGLVGFVRYIQQLELNSAVMTDGKPGGADESYVRLMSIHKSKGLEFPVVILAGMGKAFNHRKPSGELSMDKNLGLGLRFRSDNNEYYIKTERQIKIDEAVKAKEIAEEMRILYVGMTRAREKLILTGAVKKLDENDMPGAEKSAVECKSFVEWICGSLFAEVRTRDCAVFNLWRELPESEFCEAEMAENLSDSENEAGSDEETKSGLREAFRYKYLEASEIPGKFTVTELNRMVNSLDDSAEVVNIEPDRGILLYGESGRMREPELRTDLPKKKEAGAKLTAAERGTLTHKVLQEIDLSRTGSAEEIRGQIGEMLNDGRLTEAEADGIREDWIEGFFNSDLGKRLKAASIVEREKSFLLWEPYDEETGSIIQGIIDCFFEENGEIVLLDYKTDYIPLSDADEVLAQKAEKYRTQLKIYKRAIEESRGKRVKEAYLYFLSAGRAVSELS